MLLGSVSFEDRIGSAACLNLYELRPTCIPSLCSLSDPSRLCRLAPRIGDTPEEAPACCPCAQPALNRREHPHALAVAIEELLEALGKDGGRCIEQVLDDTRSTDLEKCQRFPESVPPTINGADLT